MDIQSNIRLKPLAEQELMYRLYKQQQYLLDKLPTKEDEIEDIIFGSGDVVMSFLNEYYNQLDDDTFFSLDYRYRPYQHDLKEKYLEYIS